MKKFFRYRKELLLILALLFVSALCHAVPYQVGKYRVDVTVRNSVMNLIPDVHVSCWRNGENTISIEAKASGYKTKYYQVDIQQNQFFYKRDLVLEDVDRNFYVVDHNQNIISSAYVRTEQYGFPANHYGITAFIPVVSWPGGLDKGVEVFDSFWGVPLKKKCEITKIEEFYCVKLSITRKSLKWSAPDLFVVFRTAEPVQGRALKSRVTRLCDIGLAPAEFPAGSEEALTAYIAETFSADDIAASENLPATLVAFMAAKQKFASLHRE
ncbi:MAG: hypothetical protein PHV05_09270 [Candidatus Riflebacteria bacterium]|nr:hypothetical protein [Candidatus Riflebacteria bacterium]